MFDRAIRAKELGTFHPSCLPNLCFKKSILSDQVILCGQAGIDPKLKNPVLFVHKQEFALNYAKLTYDLPVNMVMALNREEIFESEIEEDDDEMENFRESSGDEVVIINWKRLYAGTVPANKKYAAGMVPANKKVICRYPTNQT